MGFECEMTESNGFQYCPFGKNWRDGLVYHLLSFTSLYQSTNQREKDIHVPHHLKHEPSFFHCWITLIYIDCICGIPKVDSEAQPCVTVPQFLFPDLSLERQLREGLHGAHIEIHEGWQNVINPGERYVKCSATTTTTTTTTNPACSCASASGSSELGAGGAWLCCQWTIGLQPETPRGPGKKKNWLLDDG